jgi:hypothetical protein
MSSDYLVASQVTIFQYVGGIPDQTKSLSNFSVLGGMIFGRTG